MKSAAVPSFVLHSSCRHLPARKVFLQVPARRCRGRVRHLRRGKVFQKVPAAGICGRIRHLRRGKVFQKVPAAGICGRVRHLRTGKILLKVPVRILGREQSEDMAVVGIGIDMAQIAEIGRLSETIGPAFLQRTFTEEERAEAGKRATKEARLEYYAARFAAKEAVFKALAPHTPGKGFDFRHVCTLNREDGSPCVVMTDWMSGLCAEAGVKKLHISITTEGEYAAAFVVAED